MSIIIKGMDMPRNGDCHHITIYDNGNTYVTTSNVLYETDRKDIKAVQIPTPHGRLIDGDYVKGNLDVWRTVEKRHDNTERAKIITSAIIHVRKAPTILEAEDE